MAPAPAGCLLRLLAVLSSMAAAASAQSLGCNWGTRAHNPLPPETTVRLLQDNGFAKVKLFEADPGALRALGRSGIQVMVGIPNELLAPIAASVRAAEQWVLQNVSSYVSNYGVDIRYVAVGNEPFLKTYKGQFTKTTLPALQNVQAALIKAGLAHLIKLTVPLNADVYQTSTGLPSGGDFRSDIAALMVAIVRFLLDNGGALTINIYPFLSLYADPHFPIDYAFFSGGAASAVVDGAVTYTNVFDANYDTLIASLNKHGLGGATVIVGEIGWPTDGDPNANADYARRFNQGLVNRVMSGKGTPRRPSTPPDIYLFGLIDEDAKSIDPGNFERHWGIFNYDGTPKYDLVLPSGRRLVPAKGVKYLPRRWCVLKPEIAVTDPAVAGAVGYACTYADCTSLGFGSSCNGLDLRSNVSYAFNQFFQAYTQTDGTCAFANLSAVVADDPSLATCRFEIMIDTGRHDTSVKGAGRRVRPAMAVAALLLLVAGRQW